MFSISLMISDDGYFLHVPVGHLYIFFGKMSIQVLIRGFCLMLSCVRFWYILDINPLSDILFADIFSHSLGSFFALLIVSFVVQKLFSLVQSHLFIFAFVLPASGDIFKEMLLRPMSKSLLPMFILEVLQLQVLTFVFFFWVVLGLSCGRWAPQLRLTGFLVVAHRLLSCGM